MRWLVTVLALLASGPALALTPKEVWAVWQSRVAASGGSLTARMNENLGGTITLHDLTVRLNRPGLFASGSIWDLTLVPAKDGSVLAVLPRVINLQVSPHLANQDIALTFDGGRVRITQSGDTLVYALQAHGVDVTYAGWAGTRDAKLSGAIHGKEVRLDVTLGPGAADYGYDLATSLISYDVSSTTPILSQVTEDGATYHDVVSHGKFTAPADIWAVMTRPMAPEDTVVALRSLLRRGMAGSISMTNGPLQDRSARTTRGKTVLGWSDVLAGSLSLTIDKSGIAFAISEQGGKLARSGDITDLQFSFGPMNLAVTWPLLGDAFDPLRLALHLQDIEMTPEWWARHDPQARFAHDALQIDLSAKAEVRSDTMGQFLDGMHSRPNSDLPVFRTMELEQLSLSGLGAQVQAKGAFTVNNAGARPVAAGTGEAHLVGVNDLLDNLQSAGVITPSDNLSARLMLISFFRPSDDQAKGLTSYMEARPDGSIWANGNRFR